MSTLRCTNLQDTSGGNSLTTAQIYNGTAKAWVNFNGTGTVAIRAQFNVSSITDNGSGYYTINLTNALIDTNYSAIGISMGSGTGPGFTYTVSTFNQTTNACNVSTNNIYYQQFEDLPVVCVAIYR